MCSSPDISTKRAGRSYRSQRKVRLNRFLLESKISSASRRESTGVKQHWQCEQLEEGDPREQ